MDYFNFFFSLKRYSVNKICNKENNTKKNNNINRNKNFVTVDIFISLVRDLLFNFANCLKIIIFFFVSM